MDKQLFMIEFLIDKVLVYMAADDSESDTDKNFIIQLQFGPKDVINFYENHLVDVKHDTAIFPCEDQMYKKTWNRTIRVGKSYLFCAYPDNLIVTLSKFPIKLILWTDALKEDKELIGHGSMDWDPIFYGYLKQNDDPTHLHEPFTWKQSCLLYPELNTGRAGVIDVILRFSAFGDSITTEFQQILNQEYFVFRSDKVPTMVKSERIKGDDINFTMVGVLYESITLEDPDVLNNMKPKIEICTEIQSCHRLDDQGRIPSEYDMKKVRMGDIRGPCGNVNCPLAHRIKSYLRELESYKSKTQGKTFADKNDTDRNVCGTCGCKDETWHRASCPEMKTKPVCEGCGGIARSGETCEDRVHRTLGPKKEEKDKQVNYLTSITRDPKEEKSIFGKHFIVNPCVIKYPEPNIPRKFCSCGQNPSSVKIGQDVAASTTRSMGNLSSLIYNVDTKSDSKNTKFCTDMPDEKDKECKCNPPKITPPCKTFDCECLIRAAELETRKLHKSYCPLYKHKASCPVTQMNDEEVPEFEEDEPEPLPYGLPPVQIGPCPVIGRPCSVPDGFARMYKTAVMPNQPVSYSDAGKVCCSAEFNRIKAAILEYMKTHEKEDDYRCLNKFNLDTERRCCDKEQRLLALLGKSCCGSHKTQKQEDPKAKK